MTTTSFEIDPVTGRTTDPLIVANFSNQVLQYFTCAPNDASLTFDEYLRSHVVILVLLQSAETTTVTDICGAIVDLINVANNTAFPQALVLSSEQESDLGSLETACVALPTGTSPVALKSLYDLAQRWSEPESEVKFVVLTRSMLNDDQIPIPLEAYRSLWNEVAGNPH